MKIDRITYQNRRDFKANYICEHCGTFENGVWGYDDDYYHRKVIPEKKCKSCGKTAGDDYRPLTTKYPEGFVV